MPHFALVGDPGECGAELAELAARNRIDEFQVPIHDLDGAEDRMRRAMDVLAAT